MMKRILLLSIFVLSINSFVAISQNLYFPPIGENEYWETVSPESLGWCIDRIDSLYDYLQEQDSKAFILLKDGKIVLEKYFGSFGKDSIWYWASAGKTLTSFLVGKAQEEQFLDISDKSSKYLGEGWTSCSIVQEGNITIQHQLTMTTGLDDGFAENHCTEDSCLQYLADAGTRWAYHNAPYTLLEKVLTAATGLPINSYTQSRLKAKTGITGAWFFVDYDNVFFSKARSMARFGLLAQNNFVWGKDTLLSDKNYISSMTNSSQEFNHSYGYLWWLNGKQSYMLPGLQLLIKGSYAPAAPIDMFSGLGKNGQIVSISKSDGLVFVRMGNQANSAEISTVLCNSIWDKLNDIICNGTAINEQSIVDKNNDFSILMNSAKSEICIINNANNDYSIEIINFLGEIVSNTNNSRNIDISALTNGAYMIIIKYMNQIYLNKFLKY